MKRIEQLRDFVQAELDVANIECRVEVLYTKGLLVSISVTPQLRYSAELCAFKAQVATAKSLIAHMAIPGQFPVIVA